MKLVPGELSLDFIGDRYKKGWDIIPEKIDKLVVGYNDQDIRPGLLHIGAEHGKSILGILSELFLLL
jgi:hypothetical protein